MLSWLPVVLVLVVGAIVVAVHIGAMRWLARPSREQATDEPDRNVEKP